MKALIFLILSSFILGCGGPVTIGSGDIEIYGVSGQLEENAHYQVEMKRDSFIWRYSFFKSSDQKLIIRYPKKFSTTNFIFDEQKYEHQDILVCDSDTIWILTYDPGNVETKTVLYFSPKAGIVKFDTDWGIVTFRNERLDKIHACNTKQ